MAEVQWHSVAPAPVVLLTGKEALLIQRALERVRLLSAQAHPDLETHRVLAAETTKHDLAQYTAPSLFGEPRLVIIEDLAKGSDGLLEALQGYVGAPEADVTLVLIHRGEARGKKLLDAVKKSGAPWVNAAAIKKSKDIMTFAMSEFSRAKRRISGEAVSALVDAFGSDLMELAAICQQLIDDTVPSANDNSRESAPAPISLAQVRALTAGRAETTGFAIADAAIAGREREALALVRHAELSGLAPAAIVGTFASKMRQVARVSLPGASAASLGMPEWMYRAQAREARNWSDAGLAEAIESIARADAGVKGGDRDAQWALQRLVIDVCRSRRSR